MGNREITLDELRSLLRGVAGETEAADLDGDILDLRFQDLGYDSIAVLELTARIEQEHGIHLSDEEVGDAATPRRFLDLVNRVETA
ncbi:acyl carrier protein [Streptomyces sp. NPDC050759]|uniref:acyl carrier protein n=1 Tax=Streptomyces sp. NPDC050759 TaxID=3365635 RepID=UPI0037A108C0